jgi:5-formyltetrahydrofolate cyclo-ligase
VPKCFPGERKLQFYVLKDFNDLEPWAYNLLEPNPNKAKAIEKDLIHLLIVPGVVFDNNGYRIGFGGGYYDRFLADYPNETLSIVWSRQIITNVPTEQYDIPVNHIITEKGVLF